MGQFFCPVCEKQTPARFADLLPGIGWGKNQFRCSICRNWFNFSDHSLQISRITSVIALLTPMLVLWIFFSILGTHQLDGWPVLVLGAACLLLYNIAAALALARSGELVGPVAYAR